MVGLSETSIWFALALALSALGHWLWGRPILRRQSNKGFNAGYWRPRTVRPLSKVELLALSHLSASVPECLVLPQVSLSRFIKVRQTRSYNQWFSRVGRRCVDFLVCSPLGDVLGVIELLPPGQPVAPQPATVGGQRKLETLQLAAIPLWQLSLDHLADYSKIRQIILPELQAAELAVRTRGFEHTVVRPHGSGLETLELDDTRWNQPWPGEEAGPSMLLDENDTGAAPLFPVARLAG